MFQILKFQRLQASDFLMEIPGVFIAEVRLDEFFFQANVVSFAVLVPLHRSSFVKPSHNDNDELSSQHKKAANHRKTVTGISQTIHSSLNFVLLFTQCSP